MGEFAEHVIHLDMDAFFVEVERRRDPTLVGVAVLVGGSGARGVVASASYEARRRGARSAMPMLHARRMAPHAVVVPPDHSAYREASDEVFEVIDRFSPVVERLSIDEAFIDISGLGRLHDSPAACASAIRSAIRSELGLPSSAGIATTKFIAKLASRDAKPDGLRLVEAGGEIEYLHPKPVEALWGVGEATRARIAELGVSTIGQLAELPRETLERRLGVSVGGHLWELAHAKDPRGVGDGAGARSISVEQTYERDLFDVEDMHRELLDQADRLASRVRRAGYATGSVHLKVRYPDFTTVTRSQTFGSPVTASTDLFRAARDLLAKTAASTRGVRLLGIAADGLIDGDAPRQLDLEGDGWEAVDDAVDRVRERFGSGSLSRARLSDAPVRGSDRPSPGR